MKINQARALELRVEGKDYNQIARILGVSNKTAWHYVNKEVERTTASSEKDAAIIRKMELKRLDMMLEKILPGVTKGRPIITNKGVIYDPDKPNQMLLLPSDKSAETVLKIMERRAKLLGIDAPEKKLIAGDPDNQTPIPVEISIDDESGLLSLLKRLAGEEGK